jgi:putative PIN family toxin of toxin-antitoxin system
MAGSNYVLDVNIYTSFIVNRKLHRLAQISETGINLFISPELLDELSDVLKRPKIARYLESDFYSYIKVIKDFTLLTRSHISAKGLFRGSPDAKDDYLFILALHTSSVLVTGDKKLLSWQNSPVDVISLNVFLKSV